MKEMGNKVLIYRLGSLGDTVMALPCFHKVKESFPHADLTLLTNRPVATKAAPLETVLGKDYFFDRVMNYPVGTRNPFVFADLIWKIRSLKIDTVVSLMSTRSQLAIKRDRFFFKTAGISQFIGFADQTSDTAANGSEEPEWEAVRLARQVKALGAVALEENRYWDLRLTALELQFAEQALYTIPARTPILAVSIGTKNQANDWEAHNWTQLVNQLRTSLPSWRLVLIGAAEEAERSASLLEAWGGKGLNLCGKLTPRVSAAVLKRASVFVGHDSGPMHLAACVGTPCIGIFSARNLPGRWFPRGAKNRIIYHQTECAGCGLEVCIEKQKKCILSITVSEVKEAILETISIREQTGFLA
ncbi:lipopolysaccharide heptosyltransferase II [Spirosoma horti]